MDADTDSRVPVVARRAQEETVPTLQSPDGTSIAVQSSGTGPPLVLVVGAFNDRTSTASLTAHLADAFTVYEYDRRGRGDSTDTPPYDVAREVEDLAAVVAATGADPFAYGHSSGASLVLEAAIAGVPLRRVALYEPPYNPAATLAVADELAGLAADGRRGDAVRRFLGLVGVPDPVLDQMAAGPGWPHMESYAGTLAYEVRLCHDGAPPVDRLGAVAVPMLVMAGGASGGWAQDAVDAIATGVPEGTALVVQGQGHGVTDEVLVPLIRDFFR